MTYLIFVAAETVGKITVIRLISFSNVEQFTTYGFFMLKIAKKESKRTKESNIIIIMMMMLMMMMIKK